MKKYKLGYTQGVYDLFHVGHLNLLKHASEQCEKLIVGVNSDELVLSYKKHTPIILEKDRREIVAALKFVEDAIIINTLDKLEVLKQISFDAIFIGDDWADSDRWKKTVAEMKEIGIDVVFLPYTKGISSSELRSRILKSYSDEGGQNEDTAH